MKNTILLLFVFLLCGCYSSSKISNRNLAFLYGPNTSYLNPSFKVSHSSEGKSLLHFKFDSNDLLYMKEKEVFEANFDVTIESYSSFESKVVLDTLTKNYNLKNKPGADSDLYHFIEFDNASLSSYLIKVTIYDINRNSKSISYIDINKGNENLPQFFSLKLSDSNIPLFRNHIASDETFVVSHANPETERLWVRYYNRRFPLAAPPHSQKGAQIFSFISDSTFSVEVNSELNFKKPGIYHIQKDTLQKNGVTLFRLHNDFPNLTAANQLLEPLRYLTTREEYKNIIESSNKRSAIDAYWLQLAGSKERARFLIKNYYNRVQTSNQFFTSYLEGWKTDRGLIYIVFGVPSGIYKSSDSEVWTYANTSYTSAINFTFKKISNPFSTNDYVLVRKPEYEFEWYKAVETWRKGRIVNL
ncbi:MAG: GWxTD domain-containing protein [Bacteroidia bacterium]|nr:GWxTD domain-containing protein [Bacteroidia bacterium]